MAILEVRDLGISFGGLRAVNNFNVTIEKGQLYGLIGPNGAGKTTIFNLLTGVYKPTDGQVILDGQDLTGKNPMDICKAGIARTFQNIRLFGKMSVLDNVKLGLHNQNKYSAFSGIFRLPGYFRQEKAMEQIKPSLPGFLAWSRMTCGSRTVFPLQKKKVCSLLSGLRI